MLDTAGLFLRRVSDGAPITMSDVHDLARGYARRVGALSGSIEGLGERAVFLVPYCSTLSAVQAWVDILARDQSPKIPPARYERVFRAGPGGREFPHLLVDMPVEHAGSFERFLEFIRTEGAERLADR